MKQIFLLTVNTQGASNAVEHNKAMANAEKSLNETLTRIAPGVKIERVHRQKESGVIAIACDRTVVDPSTEPTLNIKHMFKGEYIAKLIAYTVQQKQIVGFVYNKANNVIAVGDIGLILDEIEDVNYIAYNPYSVLVELKDMLHCECTSIPMIPTLLRADLSSEQSDTLYEFIHLDFDYYTKDPKSKKLHDALSTKFETIMTERNTTFPQIITNSMDVQELVPDILDILVETLN